MKKIFLPALAAAALATGCMTHGDVGVGYSYGYASPGPDMYVMNNGVHVVAYADYPTFYSDNYYWMYNDGLWYRSSYYGGGWVVSYDVPHRVRSIDRPHSYARFTPGAGWTRARTPAYQGGVRDHRSGGYNGGYSGRNAPGPAVRDHRRAPAATYSPPPARDHRSAPTYTPPPAARDHRAPSAAPTHNPPPARDHRSSPPPERHNVPRGGPTNHPPARDHRR